MNYNILTSITVNDQLLYDKEMRRYNQKYKPDWTVQARAYLLWQPHLFGNCAWQKGVAATFHKPSHTSQLVITEVYGAFTSLLSLML